MKPLWLIFIIGVLISSCTGSKQIAFASDGQISITNERDGSSYSRAVVVNSIREEYEWMRTHYPEAQMKSQLFLASFRLL